jgi:hypothetical protein
VAEKVVIADVFLAAADAAPAGQQQRNGRVVRDLGVMLLKPLEPRRIASGGLRDEPRIEIRPEST